MNNAYFPFGEKYNDKMGTLPRTETDSFAETNEGYISQILLKRSLLDTLPAYYFFAPKETLQAQWELLGQVLEHLFLFEKQHFTLLKDGTLWTFDNHLLQEKTTFIFGDENSLGRQPLDWLGRQTQEDWLLLAPTSPPTLVAGTLCFANDWCLQDKLGLPFREIHAPVGEVIVPMLIAAEKLIERLPENRPVWRMNWSIKLADDLDMTLRHHARLEAQKQEILSVLTPKNIGHHAHLRLERQTLTRLPSGYVVFGIHTFQDFLASQLITTTHTQNLLAVLNTAPKALLAYKGIAPFLEILKEYLEDINRRKNQIPSKKNAIFTDSKNT